jgi:hypothetical protein
LQERCPLLGADVDIRNRVGKCRLAGGLVSQQLLELLTLFYGEGRGLDQGGHERAIGANRVQVRHQLLHDGSWQGFCSGSKELDGTSPAFNECFGYFRLVNQILSAIAKELSRRSVSGQGNRERLWRLREQGVFGAFAHQLIGVFGQQSEQFSSLDLCEPCRPRADRDLPLARGTAGKNLLI